MATNEAQIIGYSVSGDDQLETREVKLPIETWKKLDKLAETCPNGNHRTPETYPSWALFAYAWLCSEDDRYAKGILPTPVRPAKKPS